MDRRPVLRVVLAPELLARLPADRLSPESRRRLAEWRAQQTPLQRRAQGDLSAELALLDPNDPNLRWKEARAKHIAQRGETMAETAARTLATFGGIGPKRMRPLNI